MFVLGLNCISDSCFVNTIPSKRTYEKVDFYGDCTVDGIHARNNLLTESEILAIDSEEVYGADTIFLGNMEDTLEAGSVILFVDKEITSYRIRRKVVGDSLNPVLVDLPYTESLKTYTDYTVANNTDYIYTLSGIFSDETGTIEGRGLEGGSSVDFYGWILSDTAVDPVVQYIFDLDVESGKIEVVSDIKTYDGYQRFSKVVVGNRRYKKMSLKTMPCRYEVGSDERIIDKQLLDEIEEFIGNGEIKYLRNTAGEIWMVVCSNFSYEYLDDISVQPYHIFFDVIQVGIA